MPGQPCGRRLRAAAGIVGTLAVNLAVGCLLRVSGAATHEQVSFPSLFPGQAISIPGFLYRPDGEGPFPAVVQLHGCAGLGHHDSRWAEWFRSRGFAALVVDGFAPRHTTNNCTTGTNPSLAEFAGDAFGALSFLQSLPFVDAGRIGVIGWSYGGTAALQVNSQAFAATIQPSGRRFRAVVAYYPICNNLFADTYAPLLLLLGAADDWAPPQACLNMGDQLRRNGRVVEWHLYAGTRHAFDHADLGSGMVMAFGHALQYDRTAAADAETRVLSFLTKYLSP